MKFNIGWYLVYVKSRWEKKLNKSLQEISLASFLPKVKTVITQWNDREKTILKPLFPSFICVNINSSLKFYKALFVHATYTFTRFGKYYSKITEKEISIRTVSLVNPNQDEETKFKIFFM